MRFDPRPAAVLLHQARRIPFLLHDIPTAIRPQSLAEAYAVQAELAKLLMPSSSSRRIVGYKAANTNASSQKFLGLAEPFFGPLLALNDSDVSTPSSPHVIPRSTSKRLNVRLCEPEVALLVGENGRDIMAAAPAIEIVHSSFLVWTHANVGAYSLIADLACNGAWVRGDAVPLSQLDGDVNDVACQLTVTTRKTSQTCYSATGNSNKVNPIKVYEQLVSSGWFKPQPGQWITTGVVCDPPYHHAQSGDTVRADFANGLGSVAVRLE